MGDFAPDVVPRYLLQEVQKAAGQLEEAAAREAKRHTYLVAELAASEAEVRGLAAEAAALQTDLQVCVTGKGRWWSSPLSSIILLYVRFKTTRA
jgi:hypothetical protein